MTSQLREALDSVGGAPFVQKKIDTAVVDIQRRYAPLVATTPNEKTDSDYYVHNTRVKVPVGGFVREGGARPVSTGQYDQKPWKMAHLQVIGDVTNYGEIVTKAQAGSLRGREIEGAIKGLSWDTELAMVHGNADATAYGPYPQFSGFATLVNSYQGSGRNVIDALGSSLTLGMLDALIDTVEVNAAQSVHGADYMFVCSSTAASKIAQLFQAQQRFVSPPIEITGGVIAEGYRDIPLVKSSMLSTRAIGMGTVAAAATGTGGTLAAGTLYYQVSAVIARSGETIASTEVSVTTSGSTSVVDLTFATPTGYETAGPLLFRVFRGTASGQATLLGVVDAVVGVAADGITPIPTVKITDTGTALIPKNGATVPATLPIQYYSTNAFVKPMSVSGQEVIYLVPRNRDSMVRAWVRNNEPLNLASTVVMPDSQPFGIVSDTVLAIRDARMLAGLTRVGVSL